MDDHEEAMVAFSQGLATDPKESAMLTALVETMLKSSLRGTFLSVCSVCMCVNAYIIMCGSYTWHLQYILTLSVCCIRVFYIKLFL